MALGKLQHEADLERWLEEHITQPHVIASIKAKIHAPLWQPWIPTTVGWGTDPTNTVYRYFQIGKLVTLSIRQGTDGTSNSTTKSLTLPMNAATISNASWQSTAWATDNGGGLLTLPSRAVIASGDNAVTFDKSGGAAGGWTAANGMRISSCLITYEAA